MAVPRKKGGVLLTVYIHLRNVKLNEDKGTVKQEKWCENETMEELGVENERVRQQLRDAEILASYPVGLKPRVKAANSTQVGGDHYKKMDIQPWDVVDYGPKQQAVGFYRYNALKYIMRAGEKGDFKEDIQKAHHYLQKLLEII